MSLAGSDPDEAMSSTGEPTIFSSAATALAGIGAGGGGAAATALAGTGAGGGGAAATALAGTGAGGGGAGFAAIRPSSVRRASGGTPLVARLSEAPQVTQKR